MTTHTWTCPDCDHRLVPGLRQLRHPQDARRRPWTSCGRGPATGWCSSPASARPPSCRTTRKANVFNGLHGRALPAATAIKLANHDLTVIVDQRRRRHVRRGRQPLPPRHPPQHRRDQCFVHNNQVYGLTKGQASPTSERGLRSPRSRPHGVISEPFNPLAVAIALDASFVARAYVGNTCPDPRHPPGGDQPPGLRPGGPAPALRDLQQGQHLPVVQRAHRQPARRPRSRGPGAGLCPGLRGRAAAARHLLPKDKPVFEDQLVAYADNTQPLFERQLDLDQLAATMRAMG